MFSEYIKTILSVSTCALFCNLSADSLCKGKGASKALKLISNLCVFLVIILPLITAIKNFDSKDLTLPSIQAKQESNISLDLLAEKEASNILTGRIVENTGINPEHVSINISYDNDCVSIDYIQVCVKDEKDAGRVRALLETMFKNEKETEIKVTTIEEVESTN